MKIIDKFSSKLALLTAVVMIFSCESLDTENISNPTQDQVLSSGSDLPGFLAGGFLTWWQANHIERPAMALMVGGDAVSCSWGNFGMRRWGNEPREQLNNSSSESPDYIDVLNEPWNRNHSGQFTANAVIIALESGVTTGFEESDDMLEASAYLLRGLSRGYLAMLFDQAFLTDEDTDLNSVIDSEPTPYSAMLAAAISDLDMAISLSSTNTFTIASGGLFNGLTGDQDWLAEMANSYAARFLAQTPRTPAENAAVDWTAVRDYALNGLTSNFAPIANGVQWFSYQWASTATYGGTWARVDMRIMNALDPNQPTRYPLDGSAPPATVSDDKRLETDFKAVANAFSQARGLWFFGTHQHDRSDDPNYIDIPDTQGPMPVFVVEDNQMLLAEAHLRLGNLASAAAILNDDANSRNARGNLPDVDPGNATEIEDAIWYERFVEILNTAPGGQFFDRRRMADRVDPAALDGLGGLQRGTPAQLPIPAPELELLQRSVYTFGGASDAGGIGG